MRRKKSWGVWVLEGDSQDWHLDVVVNIHNGDGEDFGNDDDDDGGNNDEDVCYKVMEELILLQPDCNHEDFLWKYGVSDRDCGVGDENDGW